MKEKEISLIDLLVDILLHWRMFFVWMLLGAVLLGAFSFNRSRSAINSQKMQVESNPEDELSQEEIQNVKHLVAYENAYFSKGDYLEKSLLMKIDPNSVNKAEATICIVADDYQKSCDIAKIYDNIVQSGELVAEIAEDIDMEITGIDEVIFTDQDLARLNGLGTNSSIVEAKENYSVFRIVTMHNDETKCKTMLKKIIDFLLERSSEVEDSLGEHEIIIVDNSFGVVSDAKIAEMQRIVLDEMNSMKRVVSDTKVNLSDAERQYYNFLMNGGEKEKIEDSAIPEQITPSISIKYVILGALIAAFLYAMVLFVAYIFNTRVQITDNLQELYDIPQLGVIPAEKNRKKLFGFIDKGILVIRNRNKREFTSEEALELAAVAARMSIGKEAMQEICLIGCGLKEQSLEVCEKMKSRLKEDKIQTSILNNILYDAKMMEELEGAKGAILIESVDSTLYNEIAEELEILKRQKIKVLGGILVE